MKAFALSTVVLLVAAAGCSRTPAADRQAEWREVLEHKHAAVASGATAEQKQLYADSVRRFLERHPDHSRAREVWEKLELEFADELVARGRHRDAIRFYRSVLSRHPENEQAARGLALAADRLAIGRYRLLELKKNMTRRDVVEILGEPMPGWSKKTRSGGTLFEAWYYRTRAGAVAAVYFRDGRVIAAEESSDARLGRLGS